MADARMGIVESRFADIIWKNEPITIRELIALCDKELDWRRTTTYTVLKKLCDRGIFLTENKTVTSLISKKEFFAIQSEQFVQEKFGGSLPAFIAAFTTRKTPTPEELAQIKKLIETYEA